MDGLFLENGPFKLKVNEGQEWYLDVHPQSWHGLGYTVYIDQPVGTGLSFTKDKHYCQNDEEIDRDFYDFLQNFFKVHGEVFLDGEGKRMKRRVFFSGESHAGHYIPSMMDYIQQRNEDVKNGKGGENVEIWLGGAAIGNGWTDPYYQYAAATAAYGFGLIDLSQWATLNTIEKKCQDALKQNNLHSNDCFDLLDKIIADSDGTSQEVKVSIYDTRNWESRKKNREFPPGHKVVEAFLGGAKSEGPRMQDGITTRVLDAIHASEAASAGQVYRECTDPPFIALQKQDGLGVVPELVRVLSHPDQIPIIFFNGMNDLMCNHVGNERFLDNLPWEHTQQFSTSSRYAWKIQRLGPQPVGFIKQFQNLYFIKIPNAGHMVPLDQPDVAFEMMKNLITDPNKGFSVFQQKNVAPSLPTDVGLCDKTCQSCPPLPPLPKCPKCPSTEATPQNLYPQDAVMSNASLKPPSSTTPLHEQGISGDDSSMKEWMFGAWTGAFIACMALGCFALIRRSRRNIEWQATPNDLEFTETEYHDEVPSTSSKREVL